MLSILPSDFGEPSQPTLVIDSREQTPLTFTRLASEVRNLLTGDYSAAGFEHLLAIERKSLDDLCGSLTAGRERFERELHRLRGFHFKRLICTCTLEQIEAHQYRSKATPRAILASLCALEVRYDVPVVFAGTEEKAAALVESWVFWFSREVFKNAEIARKALESAQSNCRKGSDAVPKLLPEEAIS